MRERTDRDPILPLKQTQANVPIFCGTAGIVKISGESNSEGVCVLCHLRACECGHKLHAGLYIICHRHANNPVGGATGVRYTRRSAQWRGLKEKCGT